MGASSFYAYKCGANASEAFRAAVEEARWEYGHGGYTGTIAEKRSFFDFTASVPAERRHEVVEIVSSTYRQGDLPVIDGVSRATLVKILKVYDDKWGPAACLQIGECVVAGRTLPQFLFFGFASS